MPTWREPGAGKRQVTGDKIEEAASQPGTSPLAPRTSRSRPNVAILREQGVNSQVEMAHAFTRAGLQRRSTCT